jgi:hypothetical protein
MRGTLIERPLAVIVLFAFLATTALGVLPGAAASVGAVSRGSFSGRITYKTTGRS